MDNKPLVDHCPSCRHDRPGANCAKRRMGADGYLHFPPDGCWSPKIKQSITEGRKPLELKMELGVIPKVLQK
jgi:hypothetical protein